MSILKIVWRSIIVFLLVACLVFGLQTPAIAQISQVSNAADRSIQPYLDRVKSQVTEFKLENGMKFIVLERHQAPVVSFVTYADVGGVDEPVGKTGVAHFLEHLAFKGTSRIGTTNWQAEKVALDKLDQLDGQIREAIAKGQDPKPLQAEFAQAETQANQYVKTNEFGQIIAQAGGVGLNAATGTDFTVYSYSLPANKTELWFSLESDRFLDPVFREFYQEKEVILEERKERIDNSPRGKLIEAFQNTSFTVHPYKRPVIGYETDIRNLTRKNVQDFFDSHYVPAKLTIGIVGDVDPQQIKQLAKSYFGRFVAKPSPANVAIVEPTQTAPRNFALELETQPIYIEGYHRPAIDHPDNLVYEVITKLMSDGRRSRLYSQLVEKQQIALSAEGSNSYPGNKFPHLLVFSALPAPGVTLEQLAVSLQAELTKIQQEPVSPTELERVKKQFKSETLAALGSNEYMANFLVETDVKFGSWQKLFEALDKLNAVTAADIQRVARATFTEANRTVGKLRTKN
jgi:predicted Zn-dependent peptidase